MQNSRQIGSRYEQMAGSFLEQCGYEILEYNYRCKVGEVDIVAKEGEYLVFCEVKYRDSKVKGSPFEAVNRYKQQKISQCALRYLQQHRLEDVACRFDVVGILGDEIELIKNAFDFIG